MAAVFWGRYEASIKDNISIVIHSQQGVEAAIFFELSDFSGYKREEMAQLFDTSLKTLMRYKEANKKLSPAASELALKMWALFRKGEELFGDINELRSWLNTPAYGLGHQIPFRLMQTSGGIDLIMDELARIEFGALA